MSAAPSCDSSGPYDLSSFGLGNETSQYEYQGVDHFLTIRDHELSLFASDETGAKSQYFVFYHLSEEQFDQHFHHPGKLPYKLYCYRLELLFVKMSGFDPHSQAIGKLNSQLVIQLSLMGRLDRDIQWLQTSEFYAPALDRAKRADAAYRPCKLPPTRGSLWPTLVVEVGFSEPVRKLNSDARWWLNNSGGAVVNVVTVSINRQHREIAIEKWARVTGNPTVVFRTVLSQESGAKQINISNSLSLTITFSDLFLRLPSGPEFDVAFDASELEDFASSVWRVQFETDYRSHARIKTKRH